jgi:hypothetical protein
MMQGSQAIESVPLTKMLGEQGAIVVDLTLRVRAATKLVTLIANDLHGPAPQMDGATQKSPAVTHGRIGGMRDALETHTRAVSDLEDATRRLAGIESMITGQSAALQE